MSQARHRRDSARRCGGVLAADGRGEEGTLKRLKALRRDLVEPKIVEHHGRPCHGDH
jgi:hypothetical protein